MNSVIMDQPIKRRIQSRPYTAESVAHHIRNTVNELNRLLIDAKSHDLLIELSIADKQAMVEANDEKADFQIIINKLRIEKDF